MCVRKIYYPERNCQNNFCLFTGSTPFSCKNSKIYYTERKYPFRFTLKIVMLHTFRSKLRLRSVYFKYSALLFLK